MKLAVAPQRPETPKNEFQPPEGVFEDRLDPCRAFQGVLGRVDDRPAPVLGAGEKGAYAIESQPAMADDSEHRDAERGFQPRQIDLTGSRLEFVDHGEDQARRLRSAQDLADQEKRSR